MALPNQIDATSPLGSDAPSTIDNQIRALKQAIIDILGVPSATNVTVAFFSGAAGGLDQVIFLNAAAGATAAGRLRRNATNLTWHDGTAARSIATIDGGQTFTSATWNGTAVVPTYLASTFGQCRLARTNATTLTLSPYNGQWIKIAGVNYALGSSGITLSNTGLTASTLYYIYVYNNSGTLTLEASATAYAVDTTAGNVGVYTKNGDTSRTLVGMIRTEGSTPGQFVDSATQRFTRSWFNDPGIAGTNVFTAARATTSASYVEVNSEIRTEFVAWSGEIISASVNGTWEAGGVRNLASIGFDGATAEETYVSSDSASDLPFSLALEKTGLSEGYHYATLLAMNTGGASCNFVMQGNQAGERTALRIRAKR